VERVPGRWRLSSPYRRRRWPEGQALQGPSVPGYNRHQRTDGLRFKTTRFAPSLSLGATSPIRNSKEPDFCTAGRPFSTLFPRAVIEPGTESVGIRGKLSFVGALWVARGVPERELAEQTIPVKRVVSPTRSSEDITRPALESFQQFRGQNRGSERLGQREIAYLGAETGRLKG